MSRKEFETARTLISKGHLKEARSILFLALEANSQNTSLLFLLGVTFYKDGQAEEALKYFNEAVEVQPKFAQAHFNIGTILMERGDLKGAVKSLRQAHKFNSEDIDTLRNLCKTLIELDEPDQAISVFEKVVDKNTTDPQLLLMYGLMLSEIGRWEASASSLRRVIRLKPEWPEAHLNLSSVLLKLEDFQGAKEVITTCLSLEPERAEAHNNLGNAFQKLGRWEEAISSYHKAIVLNSDLAEVHYNMGTTLQTAGRPGDACISFQKAININPKFFIAFSNMWLSIAPLCHDILTKQTEISFIEEIIDALPTPPEPDILRLQLRSLTGGDTEEAWNNISGNMPTIQSETVFNDNKITSPSIIRSEHLSPRRMVALLHFGRSGSGYLHSLLDDHPNISTLPGVYMSGFFGREVWERISRKGFQKIPERFSSLYKVLFDARNPEKIPPAFISDSYNKNSVGEKEGFVKMGLNQDTPLTLDRGQFLENLGDVINGLEDIDHGQFFDAIHHAYERTLGSDFNAKKLIFYHLHKIDPYSMANFVKYFPGAELLMIIRNPLQSCESWALMPLQSDQKNKYKVYQYIGNRISSMLMDINIPAFQTQPSVAVRLEDIKERPKETMQRLCAYLGIEETASLYNSTMQGLKWWGDPSSSLFGKTQTQYDERTDPIRTKTGALFTTHDQFILNTLFYPLSARFGYVDENEAQFRKNLREIRPLIDTPLDFEKKLAEDFLPDYPELEMTDAFKSLHAVLVGLWRRLDEYGMYLNNIKALPI